jgi:hypothetical protein
MEREQRWHFIRHLIFHSEWRGPSREAWLSCIVAATLFRHWGNQGYRFTI